MNAPNPRAINTILTNRAYPFDRCFRTNDTNFEIAEIGPILLGMNVDTIFLEKTSNTGSSPVGSKVL